MTFKRHTATLAILCCAALLKSAFMLDAFAFVVRHTNIAVNQVVGRQITMSLVIFCTTTCLAWLTVSAFHRILTDNLATLFEQAL